jgi:hypothetical protein
MNSVSDTVLNRADEKMEAAPQKLDAQLQSQLLELGKVSDTRGSWLGIKSDVGLGFIAY